jgi:hypothetical protein
MKNLFYTILALGFFLSTVGCDKDSTEFIKTGTDTQTLPGVKPLTDTAIFENETLLAATRPLDPTQLFSIEKLNDKLEKPIYKDSITAENGGKIVTPDDVTVEFPANCCKGPNGICKGKIDIEILILKTKGELVANDKPTISNGKLLTSGGVVFLMAKQNGVPLILISNKLVNIKYKMRPVETEMKFFQGKGDNRFKFDWALIESGGSNAPSINTWRDSSQQNVGYQIFTDRFGWINCDKFNNETNLTDKIVVTLPDSFSNRNTGVFLVFKDILSVVKLSGDPQTRQFMIPNSYKGVPVGKQVVVVAYGVVKERTYFATQDLTIAQTNTLKMTLLPLSFEEAKKKIQGL